MKHLNINDIRIKVNYYDDEPTMIASIEFINADGDNVGYYWNNTTDEEGFVLEFDVDELFDSGFFDNLISGDDYDYQILRWNALGFNRSGLNSAIK